MIVSRIIDVAAQLAREKSLEWNRELVALRLKAGQLQSLVDELRRRAEETNDLAIIALIDSRLK